MKVYLCGGINGLSDADAKDWREEAKQLLAGHECVDPMRRDYRGREAENVEAIVQGDIDDIDECDIVLAMCPRPSWGTGMEIFYAHQCGKIVYIVVPDPCSPWLMHHCTERFDSLAEAVDAIR
jgi:nucleoside 2-deoxyribosyltransferase